MELRLQNLLFASGGGSASEIGLSIYGGYTDSMSNAINNRVEISGESNGFKDACIMPKQKCLFSKKL
jgi:hypothetical protein